MKDPSIWHEMFKAAMLETDQSKVKACLHAAKAAIDNRLQELQLDHGGTSEERLAISDALSSLNIVRRGLEQDSSSR
jgi:hypothetical protein